MKLLICLLTLTLSSVSMAAGLPEMDIEDTGKNYAYVLKDTAGDWLGVYDHDKRTLNVSLRKAKKVEPMASYSLGFLNRQLIESGMIALRFKSSAQPLFLFMLNHGNPDTSVIVIDPQRDRSRPVQRWLISAEPQFISARLSGDTLVLDWRNPDGSGSVSWTYRASSK